MAKTFYVTTPLYYVNALPHVGHAYTTIAADVLVRHKRARGVPAFLLTGTDEHGANIEKAAKAAGKEPQAWCDEVSQKFRDCWAFLGIEYDDFIRTTEPRHESLVRVVFDRLLQQGDIYPGHYEGWYCLPCEAYYDEAELSKGDCPVHGRPVEKLREETFFFKLSKYQEPLLKHFAQNPGFLAPAGRSAEIVNFVKGGLHDLSVTRTKVAWGVKGLQSAPGHTVYVWFDALLNYVSATKKDEWTVQDVLRTLKTGEGNLWPVDVQLVGKEIFRFHAVTWPAMLMALGLPLPRQVFAHGWWTFKGDKMSKSRGNIMAPDEAAEELGVDALRYFLLREMPFGGDGEFSLEAMKVRYNAELANTLGNLLSRVVQLVEKNLGGEIPRRPALDRPFHSAGLAKQSERVYAAMDALAFNDALNIIWEQFAELNRMVDREKPWEKAKTDPEAFKFLMFDLVWSLRIASDWIAPFMPATARAMKDQLGWRETGWGKVTKGAPLFPKRP